MSSLHEAPPFFARLSEAPIQFDEAVEHLGQTLPLLFELGATPQDPVWHAEGDVATHTRISRCTKAARRALGSAW